MDTSNPCTPSSSTIPEHEGTRRPRSTTAGEFNLEPFDGNPLPPWAPPPSGDEGNEEHTTASDALADHAAPSHQKALTNVLIRDAMEDHDYAMLQETIREAENPLMRPAEVLQTVYPSYHPHPFPTVGGGWLRSGGGAPTQQPHRKDTDGVFLDDELDFSEGLQRLLARGAEETAADLAERRRPAEQRFHGEPSSRLRHSPPTLQPQRAEERGLREVKGGGEGDWAAHRLAAVATGEEVAPLDSAAQAAADRLDELQQRAEADQELQRQRRWRRRRPPPEHHLERDVPNSASSPSVATAEGTRSFSPVADKPSPARLSNEEEVKPVETTVSSHQSRTQSCPVVRGEKTSRVVGETPPARKLHRQDTQVAESSSSAHDGPNTLCSNTSAPPLAPVRSSPDVFVLATTTTEGSSVESPTFGSGKRLSLKSLFATKKNPSDSQSNPAHPSHPNSVAQQQRISKGPTWHEDPKGKGSGLPMPSSGTLLSTSFSNASPTSVGSPSMSQQNALLHNANTNSLSSGALQGGSGSGSVQPVSTPAVGPLAVWPTAVPAVAPPNHAGNSTRATPNTCGSEVRGNFTPTPAISVHQFSGTPTPRTSVAPMAPRRIHRQANVSLPSAPPVIPFSSLLKHHFMESFYEVRTRISEGTYGEVYLGADRQTGELVALKRLKELKGLDGFPLTSLREVTALKHIQAQREKILATCSNVVGSALKEDQDPLPNIIRLRNVLLSSSEDHDIYLIFDYYAHSMAGLLSSGTFEFGGVAIAYVFRRVLVALSRLHKMGIVHRDIKPDNLLLSKDGHVFLADFGLCAFLGEKEGGGRDLTPSMINLHYRPPEMLLGEPYGPKVDVWSVGCFLAQVFLGHPPFVRLNRPGGRAAQAGNRTAETELGQLSRLCEILGPLNMDEFAPSNSSGRPARRGRHQAALWEAYQQHLRHTTQSVNTASWSGGEFLFEPSPTFRQFRGFKNWFVTSVQERRERYRREALTKPHLVIPPEPSPACVDVLTAIFTLKASLRPTAVQLLETPFFTYADVARLGGQPLEKMETSVRLSMVERLQQLPDSHLSSASRGGGAADPRKA